MKNKTLIAIAVVVLAIVIGAAVYMQYGNKTEVPTPATTGATSTAQTPTAGPEAKINIEAVCKGALAYMSFKDGASADVFVADCVAGNHPEVIERYKANLHLGTGVQI